jgi:hypothetical protein
MNHTTRTVTIIAAVIGATLVIATPASASTTNPTRVDVCLAIDDEPLCDLVGLPPADTDGGSGTEPAVVTAEVPTGDANADHESGCVQVGRVRACAA